MMQKAADHIVNPTTQHPSTLHSVLVVVAGAKMALPARSLNKAKFLAMLCAQVSCQLFLECNVGFTTTHHNPLSSSVTTTSTTTSSYTINTIAITTTVATTTATTTSSPTVTPTSTATTTTMNSNGIVTASSTPSTTASTTSSSGPTYSTTTTNMAASATRPTLAPGNEPTFIHWRSSFMGNKSNPGNFSSQCFEECKKNCTMDGYHKCFGKVHNSE